MLSTFPDSPEAVALALLDRVLERGESEKRASNQTTERRIIDLYVQCLAAVQNRIGGDGGDRSWLN